MWLALLVGCASGVPSDGSGRPRGDDTGTVDAGVDATEPPSCGDRQSDPNNCGACGRTCAVPNATAGCAMGECVVGVCDDGFFDRDGNPVNGCEYASDCVTGAACATACGSTGAIVCQDGVLVACEPPAEQCNAADDNCDGTCDEGAGCRRPIHRAFGNGHLYTTDLAAAQTAPFALEAQNFFYLYSAQMPGTGAVYLCRKSNNKYFVTASANCESAGPMVAMLGHWAGSAVCGAVPLYRLYHGSSGDHFYTPNPAERDNAVATYGYVLEGTVGYVWQDP